MNNKQMFQTPPFSEFFLGSTRISMYGVLISLGFLAAYSATLILARRSIVSYHIDRMLLWAVIPAIFFARALFVAYHLDYFFVHPGEMIAVWQGGWVWHGALFGGLFGIFLYSRKNKISLLSLLDICAPGVALGQAIGRWGNFFNQEAYGLPTSVPWGIPIDEAHRLPGFEQFSLFHPTFLYESFFDVLLFISLAVFTLKRLDPGLRRDDKEREDSTTQKPAALIFFLYLILYSLGRFGIEFLRIDIVPLALGLRAPQWISAGLIIVGAWGLVWVLRKEKKVVY
ncbi:prolipoprotein diacylglyceryl transferase [Candidatus Uhrbacteria bacterium]|nr:prolipoprotein diacylglyceryl transferase [Candidatus Uhrbacteria bacterium]